MCKQHDPTELKAAVAELRAHAAPAAAAERSVSGRSLDMILSDYEFQQNQEGGRLRQNQDMKNQQPTEKIGGMKDNFDYRVASVKP
jgi:hypothetical protein